MKILGVHDGHNATAYLYDNDKIVAALQEERIKRGENWSGTPSEAIRWNLDYAGVTTNSVDAVALHSAHMPRSKTKVELLLEYRLTDSFAYRMKRGLRKTRLRKIATRHRQQERLREMTKLGFAIDSIKFVNHQQCHEAAAYYGLGQFDKPFWSLPTMVREVRFAPASISANMER
jgi:carbamoyltransferase